LQPIKEEHVRLQNAHDLPRYLLYVKKEFADMEKAVPSSPHDNVERAKTGPSDFLENGGHSGGEVSASTEYAVHTDQE
jgi:hypothetical protein